ncbi:unnamed protein product [Mytilus edulis]|uniref:Nodulin-like domain-containing protein n=1 Tax=Mytilus edulis TaxID=6550 RepID=A0A8S3R2Y7_MYTED|nr:unnamed protein product [Mytilus edulis]
MHISSPIKRQKLRLWLSFVAGVLANALLGPSEIFYIYANELQVIFNANKKQVEMFASIQIIGNGIGFVLCTFTDSLNPMCLLVVGFVFTMIGPTVLLVAILDQHMTNNYFIMFGFLCNVHLETVYTNILPEDDTHDPSVEVHPTEVILKKTFLQIVKDPNYQLLAWLSTLAFATGSVLQTNLTVLTQVSGG